MQLKAVIVDDELASRETLRNYLSKYCEDVLVVGEADSLKTALTLIPALRPDVVFLDIEMPFGNAFDLLEQLSEITFETIFVTAYSHYAIQALNCSAAYYILKPIDIDELVLAVDKVKANKESNKPNLHTQILIDNIHLANKQLYKLVLPILDGFEVVEVKDIVRCEANDNFTAFFFVDGKQALICRTLKFYENILTEMGFMRVHKSHLINLQYVKRYRKGKGGSVVMTDNSEIDVAVTKKDEFLEKFK